MRGLQAARVWHLADAKNQTLGPFAARVAIALRGKYKPFYDGSTDTGDYVVVKNADAIKLTGNKDTEKTYWWHTGYMASDRTMKHDEFKANHPSGPLKKAIYGMLPKNKLRPHYMERLFIFQGDNIPPAFKANILHVPTELMADKYQNVTPADSLAQQKSSKI